MLVSLDVHNATGLISGILNGMAAIKQTARTQEQGQIR